MDFLLDTEEVQKEHFRSGVGTHLQITSKVLDRYVLEIKWTFHFLDLGMCHRVRGVSRVISVGRLLFVNGRRARSLEEARRRVYGGRYARFVRRLYKGGW